LTNCQLRVLSMNVKCILAVLCVTLALPGSVGMTGCNPTEFEADSASDSVCSEDGFPFVVPPFGQVLRSHASVDFGRSFSHPFVLALADGSLESDIFRFYQMQDARYLESISDAAALIAVRTRNATSKLWWLDAARMCLVVETSMHMEYGKELGYTPADIASLELTPTNRAYQAHLIDSASRGSLVEAIAAYAPCPWLYIALGQHLIREAGGSFPENHPYANWLKMYSDDGFLDYMHVLLDQLEVAALAAGPAERERAKEAFLVSVRYELAFWEQAWVHEEWP